MWRPYSENFEEHFELSFFSTEIIGPTLWRPFSEKFEEHFKLCFFSVGVLGSTIGLDTQECGTEVSKMTLFC